MLEKYWLSWTQFSFRVFLSRSFDVLDSKVHGANMGPTWVLSAPDGPHIGPIPMNLALRGGLEVTKANWWPLSDHWSLYSTCWRLVLWNYGSSMRISALFCHDNILEKNAKRRPVYSYPRVYMVLFYVWLKLSIDAIFPALQRLEM